MDLNEYWKQLYLFNVYIRILNRAWGNSTGEFFFRPDIKELNLWI